MSFNHWLLYFVTAFLVSATPGPVMLLAFNNGLAVGVRRSLFGIAGTSLGNFLLMILSALGTGALLLSSAAIFAMVKWVGAVYLIYLGVQQWRARPASPDTVRIEAVTPRALFRRSFLVAVSNPKGLIFFGALFPQFINPSRDYFIQFAVLCGTFLLIDCVWQLVYAAGGDRIVPMLTAPTHVRWISRTSGGVFIGAGVLLSTVKPAT